MKATIIRTLLGLAILAAVPCVAANPVSDDLGTSGLNFSRDCRTSVNVTAAQVLQMTVDAQEGYMQCVYYTSGILEGMQAAEQLAERNGCSLYSIPVQVSPFQAITLTLRFIDRHPELMHLPTAALMSGALYEAYPPQPARKP